MMIVILISNNGKKKRIKIKSIENKSFLNFLKKQKFLTKISTKILKNMIKMNQSYLVNQKYNLKKFKIKK